MSPEEKAQLEAEIERLQAAADAAHTAAAEKEGADGALNSAAEAAEEAVLQAKKTLDDALANPLAPSDEDGEDSDEGKDIDFEKELERLENDAKPPRSELEKAERALHFNAKRFRELGGDPGKVLGAPPADAAPAPATDKTPKDAPENQYVTIEQYAEQEAAKLAKTDAERKVIMLTYKTKIVRTGNIVDDIQNAYLIAHKGKITRSFDEIRRSANVRPTPGITPGRKPATQPPAVTLSAADQQVLRRRGYTPKADGSWESKRYILRYDPRTRQMVSTHK